jgi:hypothetical protein
MGDQRPRGQINRLDVDGHDTIEIAKMTGQARNDRLNTARRCDKIYSSPVI